MKEMVIKDLSVASLTIKLTLLFIRLKMLINLLSKAMNGEFMS
jgi:hypothetical protein